ncbi:hypothetical protein [Burkholderia ubonensis]|uniref:hypothetical protein n=1 Tax=Burkholderia ubonensis TaxID=101571 RepID=UPI000A6219FA|nr:hypothetical protein [Burkholderia ubonensis]
MDPVILTVLIKGLGMLLVIAGGVAAIRYGFHLFKDGAGGGPGEIAIDLGRVKVRARSAGATVMATAFVWAWVGAMLSPNLDRRGDEIRVYSFRTPDGDLSVQAIATTIPRDKRGASVTAVSLKGLLARAIIDANKKHTVGIAQINGQPASIDLSSVDVTNSESGKYRLSAKVRSTSNAATVLLVPKVEAGKITFYPTNVEQVGNGTQ